MNKSTPSNEEKSADCSQSSTAKSDDDTAGNKSENKEEKQESISSTEGKEISGAPSEALVIITSLVTSCIRYRPNQSSYSNIFFRKRKLILFEIGFQRIEVLHVQNAGFGHTFDVKCPCNR